MMQHAMRRGIETMLHRRSEAGPHILVDQEKRPEGEPLVSIIIVCPGSAASVGNALESVLGQTFQDIEVVVLGGPAGPDEAERLKAFEGPKTTVHIRQNRHSESENLNLGIEKARGKYICCIDPDWTLKPTYIEKAVFLAEAYYYDIIYASVQSTGEESGILLDAQDVDLEHWNIDIPDAALFAKEAWVKAGGFRQSESGMEHRGERRKFWIRLLANGCRTKAIREPLAFRKLSGDVSSGSGGVIAEAARALSICKSIWKISRQRNCTYTVRSPFINIHSAPPASKANVLFALPFMTIGGADTVLLQIGGCLRDDGYSLSFITSVPTESRDGDNTPRYEEINKGVYHLPRFLPDSAAWKQFLFHLIEARKIDIIFLVGSEFVYEHLAEIKSRYPRVRIIDQLFNEFGHIKNNRKFSQYIDMNIVATEVVSGVLRNDYGEADDKVRMIIHGVDAQQEFNPEHSRAESAYEAHPRLQKKFTVSYLGRFSEEKRPESFLELASRLRELDIQFVMVGNGPLYESLRAECAEHNLGKKVYMPGFVDDIKSILRISDVVIIPSRIEGVPIILLEALSMGVPVIASRVGGIPGVIRDGCNGFLCHCDDIDCFVVKTQFLFEHPEKKMEMAANARLDAIENLDISRMKSDYLAAFDAILRNRTSIDRD